MNNRENRLTNFVSVTQQLHTVRDLTFYVAYKGFLTRFPESFQCFSNAL